VQRRGSCSTAHWGERPCLLERKKNTKKIDKIQPFPEIFFGLLDLCFIFIHELILQKMSRHAKNNTASSYFTYAERQKLKYGTQKQRVGRDSLPNFDWCNLTLATAVQPVVTYPPPQSIIHHLFFYFYKYFTIYFCFTLFFWKLID
jgi:hypothetical protein